MHPVLRQYWPPESQIQLLVAGLGSDEQARRAWAEWTAKNDLDLASWAEVRLLAGVARRMGTLAPGSPWQKRLEGVRRFVWTNTQLAVAAAQPMLALLRESGIRLMLIKGAARLALEPHASADRAVRDIDVLVHPEDWPRALELANQKGWRSPFWPRLGPELFSSHHAIMVREEGGGTVDLHHLSLFMCRNAHDDDGLWERARPAVLRGIPMSVPSPADEVLLNIGHGMLFAPEPIADWVLDITPAIRAGEVDWEILERETRQREIDCYIAAGLLLAEERLDLPVPRALIERMNARIREPFVTDFRSFAMGHGPIPPWVSRVRAAAGLRALAAAERVGGQVAGPPTVPDVSAIAALPGDGHGLVVGVPTGFQARAHLVLQIVFRVARPLPARAVLEIAAPELVLKQWFATPSAAGESYSLVVEMPAALLTMRRIGTIEVRARSLGAAVAFEDVVARWSVQDIEADAGIRQWFDADWYENRHPEIRLAAASPLWEYLEAGALEGRNPGPGFDANAYLRDNPDVADSGINPLFHFAGFGTVEGRKALPVATGGTPVDTDESARSSSALVAASGFFDEAFYLAAYPEVRSSDLLPLAEFMAIGGLAGRSPGPRFDPEWYLRRHADVIAARVNPLVHYLKSGRAEGRAARGLSPRLAGLVETAMTGLAAAEPRLRTPHTLREPTLLPEATSPDTSRVAAAFGRFFASLAKPYERIVFVPPTADGVDVAGVMVGRAAGAAGGSMLVVAADGEVSGLGAALPEGVDFRALGDGDATLRAEARALLVAAAIRAIRPKAVMNINSRACWEAFRRYGKPLSAVSDLYALFHERDDGREGTGKPEDFRLWLPHVKRVYADTERFPDEFAGAFGLTGAARARVTAVAMPPATTVRWRPPTRPVFSVLWAGTFSRRKNIELLLALCNYAPDIEFHVHGDGIEVFAGLMRSAAARLPNLRIHGAYRGFDRLPIGDHHAFLYTSIFDGMPRVLVEAGAAGMPVVATRVGGVGELVDRETGWAVNEAGDVLDYIYALEEIRAKPDEARARGARLAARIAVRHGADAFRAALSETPGFLA